MTASISITEDDLFRALGNFLVAVIGGPVVQSQQNRVAMPASGFCQMTPLFLKGLSTDRQGLAAGSVNPGIETHTRSTQWVVQLDFYGPNAAVQAATVSTLVKTDYACTYFLASGVEMQPLYSGDPRQTSMINGEQQYESRWTMEFNAQFNPVIQVPQDFADMLVVGVHSVDATFPP